MKTDKKRYKYRDKEIKEKRVGKRGGEHVCCASAFVSGSSINTM